VHMKRLRLLGTVTLALTLLGGALIWASGLASAQTNLLVNGGLENPYLGQGAATRTAPNGWSLWVGAGAPEAFPHTDPLQVIDGAASWNIKQGDGVFTAAGYQRVSGLSAGTRVRFSASAWLYTCNDRVNSCIIPDPPYRRSDPSAGASVKVGIDPAGGTDPLSPNVVWSGGVAPYDQWAAPSVVAEARGDAVTVFMFATQAAGLAMNNVYWDNAQLVRTDEAPTAGGAPGAGAAAPPPPPVQEAPFVMAQSIRPDGSIVHIIQQGDTLYGIAYAYSQYGVTRESIAALNEGMRPNTALLVPGHELIILPPGSVDPLTGRPLAGGAGAAAPVTVVGAPAQSGGGQLATPVPTITPRGQSNVAPAAPGVIPTPTPRVIAAAPAQPDRAAVSALFDAAEGFMRGLGGAFGVIGALVFGLLRRWIG